MFGGGGTVLKQPITLLLRVTPLSLKKPTPKNNIPNKTKGSTLQPRVASHHTTNATPTQQHLTPNSLRKHKTTLTI